MPRESKAAKQARAVEVARRLESVYPDAVCLLDHSSPFELVIAVLLSAQTTDAQVNQVTPELFRRWPGPAALAAADIAEVAEVIKPCGLYQAKARYCVETAQMVLADYGGAVPDTMPGLTRLPGVGRKSANIVLAQAFGIAEGIAVDTHVYRIAHRLRLAPASANNADKVETALLEAFPQEFWGSINHLWVLFGRQFCTARRPRCPDCPLYDLCPSAVK